MYVTATDDEQWQAEVGWASNRKLVLNALDPPGFSDFIAIGNKSEYAEESIHEPESDHECDDNHMVENTPQEIRERCTYTRSALASREISLFRKASIG